MFLELFESVLLTNTKVRLFFNSRSSTPKMVNVFWKMSIISEIFVKFFIAVT